MPVQTTMPAVALPPNHPPVPPHAHSAGKKCPFAAAKHGYCPPQFESGDKRSVCPALNTMANHGYIPRNGKNITHLDLIHGLRKCYRLSIPLAILLATGGYVLVHRVPFPFFGLNLDKFDLHGGVEHDASLVHLDCPEEAKYPSIHIVPEFVRDLISDVQPPPRYTAEAKARFVKEGVFDFEGDPVIDEKDVARSRVRREKLSPTLPFKLAEIARGEMGVIMSVWARESADSPDRDSPDVTRKEGAPLKWILEWLRWERLPEGWDGPTRTVTLKTVAKRCTVMRDTMKYIRDQEKLKSDQEERKSLSETKD